MSEPGDLAVKSALSAYWQFFASFNSRQGDTFTRSLQFPHLRISARNPLPQIIERPEQHVRGMDFEQLRSTGWDHTVGAEPEVIHLSLNKVHMKGGWTRYNVEEQPILTNSVTYIITIVENQWRIQCRFGIDSGPDVDTSTTADAAISVVEGAFEALAAGKQADAAGFFCYPHFNVDPGVIQCFNDANELAADLPKGRVKLVGLEALQCGPKAVNLAIDATLDERKMYAMLMVAERRSRWGIVGSSVILL